MSAEAPAAAPPWRPLDVRAWLLLPAALTLLTYGFTLDGFFLADDFHLVDNARRADDWLEASRMQYTQSLTWVRPVVHWSFWVQWLVNGLEPLGYRLFNLVLQALNCAGVAWIAGVLVGTRRAGAVAGAAFALLPIHPEAVTWVSGRSDLLCASGLLVALLAWMRCCAAGGGRRHLVLACLGLVFALGAKEMAACGVAFLATVSLGFFRASLRRQWPGLACFAALTAIYFLVRGQVLGGQGASALDGGQGLQSRLDPPAALHFALKAVEFTTAPWHMDFYGGAGRLVQVVPLAGWALLVLAGWAGAERGRLLRQAGPVLALFLLSTLPVANWARVNGMFMSSRYLYLPSIFACVGLGLLASRAGRWSSAGAGRRQALAVLLGLALILFPWSLQLVHVNRRWDAAGSLSRQMVESLRPPGGAGRLRVTDLRDNFHGAYVFRNAFDEAATLYTDWGAGTRLLEPAEWQAQRLRASPAAVRANVYQRWLSEEGRWTTDPFEILPSP